MLDRQNNSTDIAATDVAAVRVSCSTTKITNLMAFYGKFAGKSVTDDKIVSYLYRMAPSPEAAPVGVDIGNAATFDGGLRLNRNARLWCYGSLHPCEIAVMMSLWAQNVAYDEEVAVAVAMCWPQDMREGAFHATRYRVSSKWLYEQDFNPQQHTSYEKPESGG